MPVTFEANDRSESVRKVYPDNRRLKPEHVWTTKMERFMHKDLKKKGNNFFEMLSYLEDRKRRNLGRFKGLKMGCIFSRITV